jgi:hypothetical protein
MNEQSQYLLRAIRGPVTLITIGVLFTVDRHTQYHFIQTWPVLLIVLGLLQLAGGRRRNFQPVSHPGPPPVPPSAPTANPQDGPR